MSQDQRRTRYWHKSLGITLVLLALWFFVTYIASIYANELNRLTFLDFPFGFYMGAQGALLFYVLIVWVYARYMDRLDREMLGDKYGSE